MRLLAVFVTLLAFVFPSCSHSAISAPPEPTPPLPRVRSAHEYFSTLPLRFRPDAAKGVNAVFQFELTGASACSYNVAVREGTLTIVRGRNGKADVMFRHLITGQVFLWTMNGSAIATAAAISTVGDLNWKIVASTSDYDGNGKSDVLWRHSTTGEIVMWLMNGSAIGSSASVYVVGDGNWVVQNLP